MSDKGRVRRLGEFVYELTVEDARPHAIVMGYFYPEPRRFATKEDQTKIETLLQEMGRWETVTDTFKTFLTEVNLASASRGEERKNDLQHYGVIGSEIRTEGARVRIFVGFERKMREQTERTNAEDLPAIQSQIENIDKWIKLKQTLGWLLRPDTAKEPTPP
jgi:hypothetical protein